MVVVSHLVVIYCIRIVLVADIFVVFRKRNSSKTKLQKNALYLTCFHVIWNPFENPHGIPTDPWGFIIVPIPIPHPFPWESPWEFPYPRQPCWIPASEAAQGKSQGKSITCALLSVFNKQYVNKTYCSLWTYNVNMGFKIVSRYQRRLSNVFMLKH